jgi:hypothetical protein
MTPQWWSLRLTRLSSRVDLQLPFLWGSVPVSSSNGFPTGSGQLGQACCMAWAYPRQPLRGWSANTLRWGETSTQTAAPGTQVAKRGSLEYRATEDGARLAALATSGLRSPGPLGAVLRVEVGASSGQKTNTPLPGHSFVCPGRSLVKFLKIFCRKIENAGRPECWANSGQPGVCGQPGRTRDALCTTECSCGLSGESVFPLVDWLQRIFKWAREGCTSSTRAFPCLRW